MNKIILTGRLTRDIDLRFDPNGKPVASSVLAVDRPFVNADGNRDADFIPIVVWGKAAEYLKETTKKTSRLLVEGRMQIRNFDAKDNTKHWVAEVIVSHYELLDPKPKDKESKKDKTITNFMTITDIQDEDIPW